MDFLEELRNKQPEIPMKERLRLHNHGDAADRIEELERELETWKFRGRNWVPYPVNMFGPVEMSPLMSERKFKLPRFFGKP